jgi:hypothetical protein
MSRENPEENFKRFPLMISPRQLKEVDVYRQDVGTLPAATEAMRDLIDLGLETYWKMKKEGRE